MCESVGDFYDYLHEILDKHEANYNVEDGKFHISERGSEGRDGGSWSGTNTDILGRPSDPWS